DFSVVAEVPTGEGPTDLATGDLDGDGDDDIVSSNSKDGTATVIKNNGSSFGSGDGVMFTPVLELLVGAEPLSVDMVDLDGDGDMDLALTATDLLEGPTVQVLESLQSEGAGLEFEPPTSVGVGADPVFISNGDFDANGLSDIVTANEDPQGPNGGSVTVILGEPELPCPTDVNFDGVTDFGDILELLGNWGGCTKNQPCPGDLNQDSYVNFADLLILLGGFGPC
ncbi:MAG: hypothetical protein GY715_03550, partial [Planctomycetes bacterium]|nr:hypothetical protein [Planctomycetota bacterium]